MNTSWELRVYESKNLAFAEVFSGRVELGRQSKGEGAPYAKSQTGDLCRVVIAKVEEDNVSRKHLLIEPLTEGLFRVSNLSRQQVVRFVDNRQLTPGASCETRLPLMFTLGAKAVRVQAAEPSGLEIQGLSEATLAPGRSQGMSVGFASLMQTRGRGLESDDLVRWLQAAMGVLQSAASSMEFFPKAAQALVDMVGLDSGRVLLLDQGEWKVQAQQSGAPTAGEADWLPSRQVLAKVVAEKRTFWQTPASLAEGNSLAGVKAVVAAPILSPQGSVIGALYGDRRQEANPMAHSITRLEAMLVDLLASGVAAGLARVEQEQAALRARVQFEQFFTPQLARQLEIRPELLRGQDAAVSILFCDIRGFSRISERLGPEGTVEWIRATMGALSECVQEHGGVLVDYIGDELMAMWGAPEEQADHAQRACRAALAMRARLPALNARWQSVLREEMDIGIGVNSGVARVGDIGSTLKFKYGVLGNTVNLCSRVQGATKYLKTPALITEATRSQLGPEFALRRLCRVRVVNIVDPVTLYELAGAQAPDWDRLQRTYEEALASFESKQFRLAARKLGELLHEHPDDGPSLVLMARTVNCLVDEPAAFDPVWELPGK